MISLWSPRPFTIDYTHLVPNIFCWDIYSLLMSTYLRFLASRQDWRRGGKGDNRGWDGWMVSPTQWTWVWVKSGSWWRIGRLGVLQSMGSQRVGHDWTTQLTDTINLASRVWALMFLCFECMCWARMTCWEGGSRGRGYMYTYDSLCCTTETKTTL